MLHVGEELGCGSQVRWLAAVSFMESHLPPQGQGTLSSSSSMTSVFSLISHSPGNQVTVNLATQGHSSKRLSRKTLTFTLKKMLILLQRTQCKERGYFGQTQADWPTFCPILVGGHGSDIISTGDVCYRRGWNVLPKSL